MSCPPVLLLGFNRADTMAQAATAVLQAGPRSVYVVVDGPRADRPGEIQRCGATLEAVTGLNWRCPVHPLQRPDNLGCERSVSAAISWFLDEVGEGIILEDDCIADPTFFRFCGELLERYRDDDRVGCITGDNFQRGRVVSPHSYYFSRFPHCWGWATWQRAWGHFDFGIRGPVGDLDLARRMGAGQLEARYWARKFGQVRRGRTNSWAWRWTWSMWNAGLVTATPAVNLVENIGFGDDATHTKATKRVPKAGSLRFPLSHPPAVSVHREADAFVARRTFGVTPLYPIQVAAGRVLKVVRMARRRGVTR